MTTTQITYDTQKSVNLTVGEWLSILVALSEAQKWNDAKGYRASSETVRELRNKLGDIVEPEIDAADSYVCGRLGIDATK